MTSAICRGEGAGIRAVQVQRREADQPPRREEKLAAAMPSLPWGIRGAGRTRAAPGPPDVELGAGGVQLPTCKAENPANRSARRGRARVRRRPRQGQSPQSKGGLDWPRRRQGQEGWRILSRDLLAALCSPIQASSMAMKAAKAGSEVLEPERSCWRNEITEGPRHRREEPALRRLRCPNGLVCPVAASHCRRLSW